MQVHWTQLCCCRPTVSSCVHGDPAQCWECWSDCWHWCRTSCNQFANEKTTQVSFTLQTSTAGWSFSPCSSLLVWRMGLSSLSSQCFLSSDRRSNVPMWPTCPWGNYAPYCYSQRVDVCKMTWPIVLPMKSIWHGSLAAFWYHHGLSHVSALVPNGWSSWFNCILHYFFSKVRIWCVVAMCFRMRVSVTNILASRVERLTVHLVLCLLWRCKLAFWRIMYNLSIAP